MILFGVLSAVQSVPGIAQGRQAPEPPPAAVPPPPPPFHLRDPDLDRQLNDHADRSRHVLSDEFYSYVAALGAMNEARRADGGTQAWAATRQAVAAELRQSQGVAAAESEFGSFLARAGGSLSAREAEILHDQDCMMKDNVIVGLTRAAALAGALLQEERR
jgi:hypothetical protein